MSVKPGRPRPFSEPERQLAWAAGLWNRSFDAMKEHASGEEPKFLTQSEAAERSARAGLS
jgi:hypothetical protein